MDNVIGHECNQAEILLEGFDSMPSSLVGQMAELSQEIANLRDPELQAEEAERLETMAETAMDDPHYRVEDYLVFEDFLLQARQVLCR